MPGQDTTTANPFNGHPLRIYPFIPPPGITHPSELFVPVAALNSKTTRFVKTTDPRGFLIYATALRFHSQAYGVVKGCAFMYSTPSREQGPGVFGFKLENTGPYGKVSSDTQGRAELRAIIAALEYRWWHQEGYQLLVVATDSIYVVEWITKYQSFWSDEGWRKSSPQMILNGDLWDVLVYTLGSMQRLGLQASFWLVPMASGLPGDNSVMQKTLNWATKCAHDRDVPANDNFTIFQDTESAAGLLVDGVERADEGMDQA